MTTSSNKISLETGEECPEIRKKSTVGGDHGFVDGTGTVVGKI